MFNRTGVNVHGLKNSKYAKTENKHSRLVCCFGVFFLFLFCFYRINLYVNVIMM